MHGEFQGVPVRIERMQRGARNRKRTYTRITVAFNEPLDWGLQVSHEGWLDRMATALGGEDVQIGGRQSELDKLVRIRIGAGPAGDAAESRRTSIEAELRKLFQDSRVSPAIIKLFEEYPG